MLLSCTMSRLSLITIIRKLYTLGIALTLAVCFASCSNHQSIYMYASISSSFSKLPGSPLDLTSVHLNHQIHRQLIQTYQPKCLWHWLWLAIIHILKYLSCTPTSLIRTVFSWIWIELFHIPSSTSRCLSRRSLPRYITGTSHFWSSSHFVN